MSTDPRRPLRRRRRRPDPRAISELTGRYRKGFRGAPATSAAGQLRGAWVAAVGEVAAAHSDPVRRSRAGVLTVACSSAVWAQELMARRDELLERLRTAGVEGVDGLRFTIADHVVRDLSEPAAPRPAPPVPRPTAADRAVGEAAAEGIDDEALRALIARAAAASAARGRI